MRVTCVLALLVALGVPVFSDHVASKNGIQVDVYHLPPAPVVYQNTSGLTFSPTAFTLIHSKNEAVLVDSPVAVWQGEALADWITKTIPKKKLTAVYITHGHGDHFYSASVIQERFPGVQVLVNRDVYQHMLAQYDPSFFNLVWGSLYPGQINNTVYPVRFLPPNGTFSLEGHTLQSIEVGQGDTYNSTVLYVPDVDLVVGGDMIFGRCHQFLAEDVTSELITLWGRSLDRIAALNPKVVIPSHMQPQDGYAPSHIRETKNYIFVWDSMRARARSWQELADSMSNIFPDRIGEFILLWSSQAQFGASF
ncbi:beta-lactamase-like protein [Xylogone sp. PMI_703]|nr:beta-lactamase-like protein [Xylogone sp. PMI_703]